MTDIVNTNIVDIESESNNKTNIKLKENLVIAPNSIVMFDTGIHFENYTKYSNFFVKGGINNDELSKKVCVSAHTMKFNSNTISENVIINFHNLTSENITIEKGTSIGRIYEVLDVINENGLEVLDMEYVYSNDYLVVKSSKQDVKYEIKNENDKQYLVIEL